MSAKASFNDTSEPLGSTGIFVKDFPKEITKEGWIFDPEQGKRIQGKYIFGEKTSINKDELIFSLGGSELVAPKKIETYFDESTIISVYVDKGKKYKEAFISITDIKGKEIKRMPVELIQGMNEVIYEHGYGASGIFTYTLMIDGKAVESRKMIFTN